MTKPGRGPSPREPEFGFKFSILARVDDAHLSVGGAFQFRGISSEWIGGNRALAQAAGFKDERYFSKLSANGVGSLMHIVWKDVWAITGELLFRMPFTHPSSAMAARETIAARRTDAQRARGKESQMHWLCRKN